MPNNDPKTIWQTQPTEPSAMTLEKIRRKTRELHAKTRRELIKSIAAPVVVALICASSIPVPNLVLRTVCAFAIVWSLAGQYFLNRGMRSAAVPGDAALNTSLDSYRREVERHRTFFGRFLLWWFGPVAFALAILIVLILNLGIRQRGMVFKGALLNMSPFLFMLAGWLVIVFIIRMRKRRELQREIDELNDLERENR